ncbi:GNAT family N-acetyltransferase [Arthrobacter sp. A5]|uniref:GNAT family N-acetyltransferase n=1 Tax=Arthrobacter sp. A5 TaxID=576926 RepID=UPI003DA9FBE4
MDKQAVLAAFNEQIRRRPEPASGDGVIETDGHVVRQMGTGWSGVAWSDLNAVGADQAIAAQVERFAQAGRLAGSARPWEWKHYSYDLPADLPDRLLAAGLAPGPAEALMVAEILDDLNLNVPPPPGVQLMPVLDRDGVDSLVAVHDEVFGGDHSAIGQALLAGIGHQPPTTAAVVAMADGIPVSAGRVEFHPGTEFASLWGGGTLAPWRGRGVFCSLVAHRAAIASARGFRYLQVDASADSRPILRRLGFVELATTTPFTHPGTAV